MSDSERPVAPVFSHMQNLVVLESWSVFLGGKRQPNGWEETSAGDASDKGLVSRMCNHRKTREVNGQEAGAFPALGPSFSHPVKESENEGLFALRIRFKFVSLKSTRITLQCLLGVRSTREWAFRPPEEPS